VNLGVFEEVALRALGARLGADVQLCAGPALPGPATGLRAQVFVQAAGFDDAGGATADGVQVARQPLEQPPSTSGFETHRPGVVDIDVACLCANHAQAQALAGLVAPTLLEAFERLSPPLLSDPTDRLRQLRFGDFQAHVRRQRSLQLAPDGAPAAQVVLSLRLEGFLHVRMLRKGGFGKVSAYEASLRLEIVANPPGTDLPGEHVIVHNDGVTVLDVGGWTLRDAAGRPHVYTFRPGRQISPSTSLRLWSGRGQDSEADVYWGRRRAVWNNSGDVAVLRDPEGVERARAEWSPPLPSPAAPSRRHRPAR
jgi:hypothetical protein